MKKIRNLIVVFIALLVSTFVISCKTTQRYPKIKPLSKSEMSESKFKVVDRLIYLDTICVAEISSWEWECINGIVIQEISISMKTRHNDLGSQVMRWVYTKHPRAKIEINYDGLYPLQQNNN